MSLAVGRDPGRVTQSDASTSIDWAISASCGSTPMRAWKRIPFKVTMSVSLAAIQTLAQTASQFQDFVRTRRRGPHQRATDNDPVRELADAARLRRRGDSKSDANREACRRAQSLNRRRERGIRCLAHASDAESTDKIYEPAAVSRDLRHPFTRSCRRHEANEIKRTTRQPLFALRICAHWNVGDENSACSSVCGTRQRILAGGEHGVQVSEDDHRNFE